MPVSRSRRTRRGVLRRRRSRSGRVRPDLPPRKSPGTSKARSKEGPRARSARRRAVRRERARADNDRRAQARFDYLQAISNSSRRRSARAKIMPVFRAAEAAEASRAKRRSESRRRRRPKSAATVSLGGIFDEPVVGAKSKKRQIRRKKPSGSSSPRKIYPAHVMRVEDVIPIYPTRPVLTAAEEKEAAARGRASFEEAVRDGEIITGNLEENKEEGYRNYLDRLERRMEHPGATVDIDHGDLILPIEHEHAQWALREGRGRVRLRPGTLHVPAVSSKMGGPTYLERHTGTGQAVGRSQRSDGRKRKKEPGRYVRMWNLKPGDLDQ